MKDQALEYNVCLFLPPLLLRERKTPPHRCSMQGRKDLRGTTLVLRASCSCCFKSRMMETFPLMAFSERGAGGNRSSPSPRRGRWREAPDEVIQRAVSPKKLYFTKETRLHSADIGAARRRLNVLARACSGAMFPRVPPPPFTFRGSLWAFWRGTLPFLAYTVLS